MQGKTLIGHLWRLDFDNMENHDPYRKEKVKTFLPSQHLTAHGHCAEFMAQMPPERRYLGYNKQVYPQYEYTEEYA